MEALVEIKMDKKLEHLQLADPQTEKYNEIVNEILKVKTFHLESIKPYDGSINYEEDFTAKEIDDATYITVLADVSQADFDNYMQHSENIINAAIDSISSRDKDLLLAREFGREAFLYFNYKESTQPNEATI
ncbi:hypothetical protein GV828_00585 [Flavobacterium sp. NST-5]|uniref:Uncharacterized protein n=1 Tax=Flavobacterium ichthyis TaxID=2698827 RepID=A0ABW9Z4X3_9FLAO|nr:hypothetical protein [Flavobacterium ichthyis]NBL63689.1 hypothetical protein [Flavobacterium ichthyis]